MATRLLNSEDQVFLLGRTEAKLCAVADEIGSAATAISCDVGSAEDVQSAFAQIGERVASIDVLVNNAAFVRRMMSGEADYSDIFNSFNTNVIGAAYCARAAIPLLNKGGSIINISSGAVDNNYPGYAIYGASKAALERLSLGLYDELLPSDICVTYVRCGQMVENVGDWDSLDENARRMMAEAIKMGQDPRKRPSSSFASVVDLIRTIVNLPPDLRSPSVVLKPRAQN